MKAFTVMLEQEDIERLKRRAKGLELPPHTLARSLLLLALKKDANVEPANMRENRDQSDKRGLN
jgi:hypothetical protein